MTAVLSDFKDGVSFSGQSATIGPFTLIGGRYVLAANATWNSGSLALKTLMPDAATYVPVTGAALSADGTVAIDLPAGTYELAVATATSVQGALVRVPFRAA